MTIRAHRQVRAIPAWRKLIKESDQLMKDQGWEAIDVYIRPADFYEDFYMAASDMPPGDSCLQTWDSKRRHLEVILRTPIAREEGMLEVGPAECLLDDIRQWLEDEEHDTEEAKPTEPY